MISVVLWTVCAAASLLFIGLVLTTRSSWRLPPDKNYKRIPTDRAERSCDAVLSVCALLIPATLGLLTWLPEKVGVGSYLIPLGFALLYFFILLTFTVHLRFNFLWRHKADFEVSPSSNLRFGYWLTTATSSIVLGLILLSIPVVELGLGWLKVKETVSKTLRQRSNALVCLPLLHSRFALPSSQSCTVARSNVPAHPTRRLSYGIFSLFLN